MHVVIVAPVVVVVVVVGMTAVVVVVLVVVDDNVVLVPPQSGGVGSVAALHVALLAVNSAAHVDRQSLPGLCLGQAALHVRASLVSSLLQSFGHRAARAGELSSNPARITMTLGIGFISEKPYSTIGCACHKARGRARGRGAVGGMSSSLSD
jgi:hypothetical protein